MPSQEYREREPTEVKEEVNEKGEVETVGRDGKKYSGHKRGPKFKDGSELTERDKQRQAWAEKKAEEQKVKDEHRRKYKAEQQKKARQTKQKRLFLVRAFVRKAGNVAEMREEIRVNEREWAKWAKDEELLEWLEGLDGDAAELMEEHILLQRYETSLMANAQGNAAAKVVLPVLNKRRYNQTAQARAVDNDEVLDTLKSIADNPLSPTEIMSVLFRRKRKTLSRKIYTRTCPHLTRR